MVKRKLFDTGYNLYYWDPEPRNRDPKGERVYSRSTIQRCPRCGCNPIPVIPKGRGKRPVKVFRLSCPMGCKLKRQPASPPWFPSEIEAINNWNETVLRHMCQRMRRRGKET